MGAGTKTGNQVNSQPVKADQSSTKLAELKVENQQLKEALKRQKAASRERLALYWKLEKKRDVLNYVRLTTKDVALLLNVKEAQVRRLYAQGKLEGIQWEEGGRIQFSLSKVQAYMDKKTNK